MDGKEHGLSTFWTDSDDKSMQCLLWWLLLQCDIFQQCWKYVEKWSHKGSFGKIACWAIGKWKRDSIGVETSSNENAASWFEFWEVPLVSEGWTEYGRNLWSWIRICMFGRIPYGPYRHVQNHRFFKVSVQAYGTVVSRFYSPLFSKIASKNWFENFLIDGHVSKMTFTVKVLPKNSKKSALNSKTIPRAFLLVLVKSNRFGLAC